ncbi:MAG: transporter substrate-binding domain-containing protein [Deltaproteobacteria bacterium]|nr:transporter substrate-binding domain-containing protein [Deltaproteobacteria bacterium]
MRRWLLPLFLLAAGVIPAGAAGITVAADHWCPINCEENSTRPGIMIEMAQKIFARQGYQLKYRALPWSRAIAEARAGRIDGVVGAFEGDVPDFIFPENEIMELSSSSLFVRKTSSWEYLGMASLKKVSLGIIRGYDYGEELNAYIQASGDAAGKIQTMSAERPLEKNIRKLLAGRVDVLVESAPVFWYTATQLGLSRQLKEAGRISRPRKCYIAFSPARAEAKKYAALLSAGIADLKKSGEYQSILLSYGMNEAAGQ